MANNKNILLIILFILSIIAPTFATNTNEPHTYYVTTNGNDQNNGLDWEHSKQHINETIEIAENGDTIIVGPGTYKETGTGGIYSMDIYKDIKIIGINKPTITHGRKNYDQLSFTTCKNCLIQGFIFNCSIQNLGQLTVKDCEFKDLNPTNRSMDDSITNYGECRLIDCYFQDRPHESQILVMSNYGGFSCVYMTHCTFESKYKKNKKHSSPLVSIDTRYEQSYVVWDQFTRDQVFANDYGIYKAGDGDYFYLENELSQVIKDKSPFLFGEESEE